MALVFFLLQIPARPNSEITLKEKLRQLNALGLLALLPGVICLCLALQWGGTKYAVSFQPGFPFTFFVLPQLIELTASSGAKAVLSDYWCSPLYF